MTRKIITQAIAIPLDTERRKFFKYLAFGGAAVASAFVVNKFSKIENFGNEVSVKQTNNKTLTEKRNKIGDSLAFVDNKKETVFYDKKGEEIFIFEK